MIDIYIYCGMSKTLISALYKKIKMKSRRASKLHFGLFSNHMEDNYFWSHNRND